MNADLDPPLYTRAARAPWREILGHRWSGRRDRALVLRDRAGDHHLAGTARRRFGTDEDGPGQGAPGLWGYDGAYLVQLDERPALRAVGIPTPYGTESFDVHVLWWAHDPVQVVRTATVRGWYPVRKDLEGRLRRLHEQYAAAGRRLGASEVMQYLAAPYAMADCGLGYRVTDVCARENADELRLGDGGGAGLPRGWNEESKEEYEFCRRAVQQGPVYLAALWLARRPEEVRQVLDWTVDHADLLRGATDWQDAVAGLLGRLTPQEQQELSRLLRDRLVALGRSVPGPASPPSPPSTPPPPPPSAAPEFGKVRIPADGWAGGMANGAANGAVNGVVNGRPL
ncbi:hypothetical protein [Kitasatospora sp. NPDC056184]|uniref:hypothetical protein n=1 Tax=Kitasatospora sp. NPDC056184 TaxID=3345738 RepID=UPI0035E1AEE8